MKALSTILAILFFAASSATAQEPVKLLFDFEENAQGWTTDWGLEKQPEQAGKFAAKGSGSLAIEHHFRKDNESIGIRCDLGNPIDFTSDMRFKGFSAWIYIPKGNDWEAQLYVATGGEWNMSWGELYRNLKSGWHKIFIKEKDIADPSIVQAVGVQIKNFRLNTQATVYIDYVQAEY